VLLLFPQALLLLLLQALRCVCSQDMMVGRLCWKAASGSASDSVTSSRSLGSSIAQHSTAWHSTAQDDGHVSLLSRSVHHRVSVLSLLVQYRFQLLLLLLLASAVITHECVVLSPNMLNSDQLLSVCGCDMHMHVPYVTPG
jgi:hypothetical protein